VEFVSSATHGNVYCMNIGVPIGDGTMVVGAGKVTVSGRHLAVGCSEGSRYSKSSLSGGVGHLVVTGGVLRLSGAGYISEGQLTGLRLGDGGVVADSIQNNYKPWSGFYLQTGGAVTNNGSSYIGGQRGSGEFVQRGGNFFAGYLFDGSSHIYRPFVVGLRSGTGSASFEGGTADIRIRHADVRRKHLWLNYQPGRMMLTLVGRAQAETPVTPDGKRILRDGDQLLIGKLKLMMVFYDVRDAAAAENTVAKRGKQVRKTTDDYDDLYEENFWE